MPGSSQHMGDSMAIDNDDRITANSVLRRLPPSVFERLKIHITPIELIPRQVLYRADVPLTDVYFITRGLVSQVMTMADGRTVEATAIGPEGIVGALAAFAINRPMFDTIVQLSGTADRIPYSVFREEAENDAETMDRLRRYIYFTLRRIVQMSACNSLHSVEQRCCRWLLIAHDSAGGDGFTVTQQVLSSLLGVQRVGVTIAAGALQRVGLIRYSRGHLSVTDRAGLEAKACECYAAIRTLYDEVLGDMAVA